MTIIFVILLRKRIVYLINPTNIYGWQNAYLTFIYKSLKYIYLRGTMRFQFFHITFTLIFYRSDEGICENS